LDSNVILSALSQIESVSPAAAALREAARQSYALLCSRWILDEVGRNLAENKYYAHRLGAEKRAEYLRLILRLGTMVDPAALTNPVATHPEDDWVLATAASGNADYLVTGDKQLLAMDGRHGLGPFRIVTPAEFLAILEEQGTSME
jgi:putative PIN family toxin of toxin-antitoxin system